MDNYIRVPNAYFQLSTEELYLYNYLSMYELRWFSNEVFTSVNNIAKHIKLMKNESQNKNRIKEVIVSLHNKNVVELDNTDIKNNDALTISIVKVNLKKGFEQIPFDLFQVVSSSEPSDRANEFFIMAYILKVKKEISFVEWANALQVDERTAQRIVNAVVEKKMIHKKSGRYYLTNRQEANTYLLNEDYDPTTVEEQDEIQQSVENENETSKHNWFDYKADLTVNDFVLFLTTNDAQLKTKAQARINVILSKAGDKGKAIVDKLMQDAKNQISKKERQIKQEEREQEQKNLIQMIQTVSGVVIVQNDSYQELQVSELDKLKMTDCIVYVDDTDEFSRLQQRSVKTILQGESDIDSGESVYSEVTTKALLNKLKSLIVEDGVFRSNHVTKLELYRNGLLKEVNNGKKIKELWEGDRFDLDGRNLSLAKRIQAEIRKQKQKTEDEFVQMLKA